MRTKSSNIAIICLTVCLAFAFLAAAGCSPSAAPQSSKENSRSAQENATTLTDFSWSPDADCTICHEKQNETLKNDTSHGALSCTDCHTDIENLKTAHENAKGPSSTTKLSLSIVADTTCLSCHEEDHTPEASAGSLLTDKNGTQVNPHDLPANEKHDTISCSECHAEHKDDETVKIAEKVCIDCHHENVYECGTCHEPM